MSTQLTVGQRTFMLAVGAVCLAYTLSMSAQVQRRCPARSWKLGERFCDSFYAASG